MVIFHSYVSLPEGISSYYSYYLSQGAAVTRMATMAFFTWSMTSAHSAEMASARNGSKRNENAGPVIGWKAIYC